MTPPSQLQVAYAEWRRLAEAEGQAIRTGNWTLMHDCQEAVAALRKRIDSLNGSDAAEAKHSTGRLEPARPDLRGTILDLIELQRKNLSALDERRRRLTEHVETLARASRNLREIQRSYCTPAAGVFSSYS